MLENWKLALNKRHLDISISYTVSQESLSATRQKLLPLYVPVKYIMKMGLSYWILLAYSYFAQTKCFKHSLRHDSVSREFEHNGIWESAFKKLSI